MGVFSRTLCFSSSSSTSSLAKTTSTLVTILLFLAFSILSLSPSASAEPCTPEFKLIDNEEADLVYKSKTEVIVREGFSFKMFCNLSNFNTIKWAISGREITPQLQDEWDIDIESKPHDRRGRQETVLTVNNATKVHNGEYKCTSVCSSPSDGPGANVGVTVTVSIAINITLNGAADSDGSTYKKFAAKDKPAELECTAKAANAIMMWKRVVDKKEDENMSDVCAEPDLPNDGESKRRPPPHCWLTTSEVEVNNVKATRLTLSFHRLRKDSNETQNQSSDFRKYICIAKSEGNQDGKATMELLEMVKERFRRSDGNDDSTSIEKEKENNETVSATRNFGKGFRSVTVVQGERLEIYCDINGVTKSELDSGHTRVHWIKDGKDLDVTSKPGFSKIEMEKPLRTGYAYEMAEPEHRGTYTCIIKGKDKEPQFEYYVRVKDKLGALWPFLAICGEVVILCTIILIYEQRRNKAELDESDTDGSPDQKNSNDDGD